MLNKRAQISEIMTWIVATLIIISILIIFLYASTILAQKTKIVQIKNLKLDSGKGTDLLEIKNLIAYESASNEDKQIIENWKEKNNEVS